jgi:hypothetical protein
MRLGILLVVLAVGALLSVVCASGSAWAGTNWIVHLATGSQGDAHAQALPAAPAGPAASCNAPVTAKTIKVTWSAVSHATTYSVYDSTTSASGTYTLIASGVATTSWTSGALTSGTRYWFEVVANVGSNWSSVKSAATGSSLINAVTPFCTQP